MSRLAQLIGASFAASCLVNGRAVAQNEWREAQSSSSVFTISLPTQLDGRTVGDLSVGLENNEIVFIEEASWTSFAGPFFDEALIADLSAAADNGRIDLAEFRSRRLGIDFDPASLIVTITPLDEQRKVRPLSVRPQPVDYENIDQYDLSGRSAYLNVIATQEVIWANDGSSAQNTPLQLTLDGAARPFGTTGPAIEGSLTYSEDAPGEAWRRGEIRIVQDDVSNAIRYSAGDVFYRANEFQGSPPLLGVSVERAYDEIQPLNVVSPTGRRSFTLNRVSTVEVFVNGLFQRTLRLEPGRYDLSDFAFNAGVNDVELVIEDASGVQRRLDFSLFSDPTLLKAGTSEFSANVGVQRDNGVDEIDYDFDAPAWSGFYRRGVTDNLTVGLDYQGENDLHVFGGELSVASIIGAFTARASASQSDDFGGGSSASLQWRYDFYPNGSTRPHEIDVVAVTQSADYLTLGEVAPSVRYGSEYRARYSAPGPLDTYLTLDARHAEPIDDFAPTETGFGASLSRQFGRFSGTLRVDHSTGEEDDLRVALRLSTPIGSRQLASTSYDSTNDSTRLDWARFGRDVVGGYSAAASLRSVEGAAEFEGDILYSANRFEASAQHIYTETPGADSSSEQRTSLRLGSSFAIVDGKAAIGRPIFDSFALVSKHPTLDESRVMVDETTGGYTAIADDFGPAIVPNVDSYITREFSWTAESAPLGYDLGNATRNIFPHYRSGTAFTAGSAASITAVGVALYPDNQPIVLVAGTIRAADFREFPETSTFTNRTGRFAAQGLEPGRYIVEFHTDTPQFFSFEIDQNDVGVVQLKNLKRVIGS